MSDTREFPVVGGGAPLSMERSEVSRSVWTGECPTCTTHHQEHTCYRCDQHIPYPPGIRLVPPFGSLDSRADNWLCPDCLVALQRWLRAPEWVVVGTRKLYLPDEV